MREKSENNSSTPMRATSRVLPLPKGRMALLVCVGIAVLIGTLSALNRSNLPAVITRVPFADAHGAIMIFGFLGTAISLERAVAFQTGGKTKPKWGFGAPILGVLGTLSVLLLIIGGSPVLSGLPFGWWVIPGLIWTAQMIVLAAVYLAIWRRQNSISVLIQFLAAVSGVLGAGIWALGTTAAAATPWWLMFLVLSIIGERLELSHVSFVASWVEPALITLSATVILGLVFLYFSPIFGYIIVGSLLLGLLAVMLYNDTAVRTYKVQGFTGFMGQSMLGAYVWGIVAAFIWIFAPMNDGSLWTDGAIHALALGFAMNMVVAHVSIIVPAITRRSLPYSPILYVPWILINIGVLLRLVGAALKNTRVWQSGDVVSIVAVFILIICILSRVVVGSRRRKRKQQAGSAERTVSKHQEASNAHMRHETHSRIGRRYDSTGSEQHTQFLSRAFIATLAVTLIAGMCVLLGVTRPQLMSSNQSSSQTTETTQSTGHTTTVSITAENMAFDKEKIEITAGDNVVITFTNKDDQNHDIVLSNGVTSGQVAPGATKNFTVGIVKKSMNGWCSISGHKEMGMEFVLAVEGASTSEQMSSSNEDRSQSLPSQSDILKAASKFDAVNPDLPDFTAERAGTSGQEREITLTIREKTVKITDGFTQKVWQYNSDVPAPTLRGRVGDIFHVTIKNETTMQHNVDFHAGLDGNPDDLMGMIAPGKTHEYTYTAQRTGIWLYHCSNAPMSVHMANGMIGAVVIEPREGLPHVDHEYIFVQSEMYLGSNGSTASASKVAQVKPDIVQFNGRAYQYVAHPIQVKTGEKVRVWLLNAGPNLDLDFHIVGAQFSTVWSEGSYKVFDNKGVDGITQSTMSQQSGSQTVDVATSTGAFVETTFSYSGSYTFLNHKASYAEMGAKGIFKVTD